GHVEHDPLLHERLEADTLQREVPDTDRQRREAVGPVRGARLLALQTRGWIRGGESGAGHGLASVVQDASLELGARGLGGSGQDGHEEHDGDREGAHETEWSWRLHGLASWTYVRPSVHIHFHFSVI